jgi:hypothetical protein
MKDFVKDYKLYTIANKVKCVVPLDTYILVLVSSPSISGKFVGKISKDGRGFQGVYSYNVEFRIFSMSEEFNKSCFSGTADNGYNFSTYHGLILSLDTIVTCREFLDIDVPLIVNWEMSDKFKQEVFGL